MGRWKLALRELWQHVPFTAAGAVTGIVIMVIVVFTNTPRGVSDALFYTFHPLHVLLSALVTTAMYRRFGKHSFWKVIIIGYVGSIGIGTLSDALIPYWEGTAIHITMQLHLPFIETEEMPYLNIPAWIVINAAALLGIAIGYFRPRTKIPHASHVLVSTWASLFNFTAFGIANWIPLLPIIFLFLFLSVWIPCCFSDIVFPILFLRGKEIHHAHEH